MALQGSGAISLDDIHVEAGGTTSTEASINDADIRGLIGKSAGVAMSFSEWYGASAITEQLYNSPGSYNFTVPSGVTSITTTVYSGAGGGSSGYYTFNNKTSVYTAQFGNRGQGRQFDSDTFTVVPGETVSVVVGAGGSGGPAPGTTATTANSGASGGGSTVTYASVLRSSAPGGLGGTHTFDGGVTSAGFNNGAGATGQNGSVLLSW